MPTSSLERKRRGVLGFGGGGRFEGSIGFRSDGICCRQGRETQKGRIWQGERRIRSGIRVIALCVLGADGEI